MNRARDIWLITGAGGMLGPGPAGRPGRWRIPAAASGPRGPGYHGRGKRSVRAATDASPAAQWWSTLPPRPPSMTPRRRRTLALAVNGAGPQVLAEACRGSGAG